MDKAIVLVVMALGALMLLKALTPSSAPARGSLRPVARRFMTPRELAMLDILERCLPQYRFHAQVSMGALLNAAPNPTRRRVPSDRNAFAQKIVDFVAQDRTTGAIVALIEVDDASHNLERDGKRDAMTEHAGYRTVRIGRGVPAKLQDVRVAIAALLPAQMAENNRSMA